MTSHDFSIAADLLEEHGFTEQAGMLRVLSEAIPTGFALNVVDWIDSPQIEWRREPIEVPAGIDGLRNYVPGPPTVTITFTGLLGEAAGA